MINRIRVHDWLDNLSPRGWTLLAALSFGLGAMVTSILAPLLLVGLLSTGGAIVLGVALAPPAGIGGFTVGGVSWWFGVEIRHSASTNTGVYVGGTTGLLSHFLVWFVSSLGRYEAKWEPYTLLEFVRYIAADVVYLGLLSAISTGIVTVPVGGYIGWRLVRLRRSTIQKSAEG